MPTEDDESGSAIREIAFTGQFKKDFKRERRGCHRNTIAADLQAVVEMLAADVPLAGHMVDHALSGTWKDHRDCHLKLDLVLIDQKVDPAKAKPPRTSEMPKPYLVRLGSHSGLGI